MDNSNIKVKTEEQLKFEERERKRLKEFNDYTKHLENRIHVLECSRFKVVSDELLNKYVYNFKLETFDDFY
jgi:hypothetical protein